MRLFFAVALPAPVRERLAQVVSKLQDEVPGAPVSWVAGDNVHVTLRFLGEVEEARLPALVEAGKAVAAGASRLEVVLEKLGTFGGKSYPRVIWAGLREDDGLAALRELAGTLETAVAELGFEGEDRPFAAHATIGRVRDKAARTRKHGKPTGGEGRGDLFKLVEALAKVPPLAALVPVDRFVLYESRLRGANPPEYVEAASFPLLEKK